MKVEITSAVHWDGEHRDVGSVIEVKQSDADWLTARGKAIPYVERAPLENRAVFLLNSAQPVIQKRTWKKKASL